MKTDKLKAFVSLRKSLLAEKAALESRVREIDRALTAESGLAVAQLSRKAGRGRGVPSPKPAKATRRGRKRIQNPMSLKEAVLKATAKKPLTKQEILAAVAKMGYRFGGKDPVNRLGVLLYGKSPKFKNDKGRFSLLKA